MTYQEFVAYAIDLGLYSDSTSGVKKHKDYMEYCKIRSRLI